MDKNHSKMLGTEAIGALLLRQSFPAIIGILIMGLYNVVDAIYISRGVGLLGLAGVTVAFPVLGILMALAGGVGIGGSSVISRRLGSGSSTEANLAFGNILAIIANIGIIGFIAGIFFTEQLLMLFGTSNEIMPYAVEYLRVVLLGSIFFTAAMAITNVIRSEGNAKMAMMIMLAASVLNVIITPVFVFVFEWGVTGAALATVISQMVAVIVLAAYFVKGKSSLRLEAKNLKIDIGMMKEITFVGSPTFVRQVSGSILFIAANHMLLLHGGELAIAILGIVYRVLMFTIMPIFGIAQGMQPIMGYNYGAKQMGRVKEVLYLSMKWATIFAVSVFIFIMVFPEAMIRLFSDDPLAIETGKMALRITFSMAFLTGIQMVAGGMYQALGMPKQAMLISLSRQIIFLIPLILILPNFLGSQGVWWAFPIAEFMGFLLTLFFLQRDLGRGLLKV